MSMLNTNLDLDITEFATVDFGVLAKIIELWAVSIWISQMQNTV